MEKPARTSDPWARSEYRRLIAWDARIEREGPWLLELLDRAPERSTLDIGCGTGEHTAFFARQGARAVGLDRSESMIEKARDHEERGEGSFLLGEATQATELLGERAPFGLAVCLGNMLPYVMEEAELDRILGELANVLLPSGIFLLQILNYRRIIDQGVRHLPVNVRPGDGEQEIVFLRLLRTDSEERISFYPTTLLLDHGNEEEPVTVKSTRRVELRPWTAKELVPAFEKAGFSAELKGDMKGGPFLEQESHDLVVAAVRRP